MTRTQRSATADQSWMKQALQLSPSARQLRGRALVGLFAAFSQVFVSGAAIAQALPSGGTVTSGSATISTPTATSMQINQASQQAVLEWNSFSIGAGNSVVFAQPNSSSVALNRVIGVSASQIYGNLSANGQVFLVNANGIYFAPGAQVEVGGLVASTLGISNSNFLAGQYIFENGGGAGSVVNAGSITALAGYAALVGPQVSNTGVVTAQLGSVALAAGNKVTLDIVGDGLMNVVVDAAAVGALALNSGTLAADGGQVLMSVRSADAILDKVLNTTGVIRANTLTAQNGKIILDGGERGVVLQAGQLQASGYGAGQTGGTVKVLGDRVGLMAGSSIDASGSAGGGTVLVGGNFQGQGPERNATVSYVAAGASVKADAVDNGNGGKIIVWADDSTRYSGSISARGGAQGGNGGFVEVSGKRSLIFAGQADMSAPMGAAGSILLDPDNLYVTAAGVPTGNGAATEDTTDPFNSILADAYVTVTSINAIVGAVTLSAVANIIFETSVALGANPTSLTATAGTDVTMAGFGFTATNASTNVSLTATTGGVTGLGATDLNGGTLTINAATASTATGILSNLV